MHTCSAIIVTCIDFRFQSQLEAWAREHVGERNYDRVALAGGIKNLDVILTQIDVSNRLHQIKKVVLINHEDCGAYGAAGTEEKHREDLTTAAQKVKADYPHLSVETYYAKLDDSILPIA